MTAAKTVKANLAHLDTFRQKAFAMFDELSASGFDDKAIGLVLIGMAVSALTEGGVTREMIHALVDQILNERAVA